MIGEMVWCGKKTIRGSNVGDALTVKQTTLKNLRITDNTTELEEDLLKVVRDGADKAKCRLAWEVEHINAALGV